jgi:hypothetical protein
MSMRDRGLIVRVYVARKVADGEGRASGCAIAVWFVLAGGIDWIAGTTYFEDDGNIPDLTSYELISCVTRERSP